MFQGELHVMWSDPFPTSEVSCDDENNPSPSPSYSLADVHVTKRLSSMTSDTSNERIDSYPFNSDFRAALQNSSCTPKMFVEGNDAAHSLLGDLTKRGLVIVRKETCHIMKQVNYKRGKGVWRTG